LAGDNQAPPRTVLASPGTLRGTRVSTLSKTFHRCIPAAHEITPGIRTPAVARVSSSRSRSSTSPASTSPNGHEPTMHTFPTPGYIGNSAECGFVFPNGVTLERFEVDKGSCDPSQG
jgi:hypothetical protein